MEHSQAPALIAIDWGTSRFRGYLVDAQARILGEVASEEGMASVRDGAFANVLAARCGTWLDQYPKLPVLMAGMVGSRNGWKEAPYVRCPAAAADLMAGVQEIAIAEGRIGGIVPGLLHHESGTADVIRGEETKIFGTEVRDGLIVMPGTHCKWAQIEAGKVAGFRTYMTGEFYDLLRHKSVLRLLAEEPDEESGFALGLAEARKGGGILHQAFAARTMVLDGQMKGSQVGPFLSGLLIGSEMGEATRGLPCEAKLTVIAERVLARNYAEALAASKLSVSVLSPAQSFVRGMLRLVPEWMK